MQLKEYFLMVLKSLNPNKHKDLVKMTLFDLVKFFVFAVFLGIFISILTLLPTLLGYQENIGGELGQFENFNIDADVSLDEAIVILKRPAVVIDFEKDELTNEWVLINNNSYGNVGDRTSF